MNEEIKLKIITYLREFLNTEEIGQNKLNLLVKTQMRKCLNYMNREDFPVGLVEPLAEAIALEYLENSEKEVKRVTTGDTSIEYNTSSPVGDKITISMREQLNKFRRVGIIGTIKESEEK